VQESGAEDPAKASTIPMGPRLNVGTDLLIDKLSREASLRGRVADGCGPPSHT
jgi:hypothetical protein